MGLQTTLLNSPDQLRARAAAWDRLWEASDVTMPTARAELAALWSGQFASSSELTAVCVEEKGEMLAALPLIGRPVAGPLHVGDLTSNFWSANGDFLLHLSVGGEEQVDAVTSTLDQLSWPLLWLEAVPYRTARWRYLLESLERRGHTYDVRYRYLIGQVEIGDDFERYLSERSKQFARTLRKRLRRLEATGPVELEVCPQLVGDELDRLLREAFEIERRGWKGDAGTAVLDAPGVFDFYLRQARQLAVWNQFFLVFLVHRGKRIAFEMGWAAKGVYHSFKVGYDAEYQAFGPGHLLRLLLIKRFHEEPGWRLVDFQGPMTEALAAWSTRTYEIGRLLIAPKRIASRVLLTGVQLAGATVRRLRRIYPARSRTAILKGPEVG